MPESSADPMIKLFGRTIPLPPPPPPPSEEAPAGSGSEGNREEEEDLQHKEDSPESVDRDSPESEERIEPPPPRPPPPPPSSTARESPKPAKASRAEEPASETNSSQEKTMKKPDKIIPCPRCKSMETKFCYYNNYNVNQPRHFCKNCQRYWTAGGTMRNVPVGAGRRKNKSSATHYRHITMSDACLQAVRSDAPQPILHPPSKPGGTVLSFGSDMPLCESMASALNLADKTMKNCHQNGSRRMDETIIPFSCGVDNGDEHLSGSSVANPNSNEGGIGVTLQEPTNPSPQLVPAPLPYLNGSPWPYPWSPAPAFCAPGFSIPFYPAPAYWGCTLPGAWTIPWLSPVASASPRGDSSMSSGPNSPSLGKHSREGDVLANSNSEGGDDAEQSRQERSLWVPKTLRIDNPDEAAKSSIWAMMGLQNDKTDATSRGDLFKAFQPKINMKTHRAGGSEVLHANPAALSRSVSFQESA